MTSFYKKLFPLVLIAITHFAFSAGISDFLPSNALIYDVGAHDGEKTNYYLSLGARQVICIEPQPSCIEQLNYRFAGNPKVTILPLGLSNTKEEIIFWICSQNTNISTASADWQNGRFKDHVWEREITIPVTTLDNLIEKYGVPDFCKIDVSGHELNVLKGLTQPIPYLSFGFSYEFLEQKTKPCLEYLSQQGYKRFNVTLRDTEALIFKNWISKEDLVHVLKNAANHMIWGDIYAQY